jgi:uncharacterized protein YjiS (DUF1127 family)
MVSTTLRGVPSRRRPGRDWTPPRTAASDDRDREPALYVALASIRKAWRRWRTRQCLSAFDDHMLRDIGLTRAEAEYELNKPFWRA